MRLLNSRKECWFWWWVGGNPFVAADIYTATDWGRYVTITRLSTGNLTLELTAYDASMEDLILKKMAGETGDFRVKTDNDPIGPDDLTITINGYYFGHITDIQKLCQGVPSQYDLQGPAPGNFKLKVMIELKGTHVSFQGITEDQP